MPAGAVRRLTAPEPSRMDEIFQGSIDYAPVWLSRDLPLAWFAPVALGSTVHLKSSWGHFVGDSLALTPAGMVVLLHELVHVWQYQNGGLGYIPRSLWAQAVAVVRTGNRGGAYLWQEALAAGRPWARWNPEQQAQAIAAYGHALWQEQDGCGTDSLRAVLAELAPAVAQLRQRVGATPKKA